MKKSSIHGYVSPKPRTSTTTRPRHRMPEQVEEAAKLDPDNPPLTPEQLSKMKGIKKHE